MRDTGPEALRALHRVPSSTPVRNLAVSAAFAALTPQERLYAHHMARAAWKGSKGCLDQVSRESPQIFRFLMLLFKSCPDAVEFDPPRNLQRLEMASKRKNVSDEDWKSFLAFAAAFFANMGNYLSFGDSKIVPALPVAAFGAVVEACPAVGDERAALEELWGSLREPLYSLDAGQVALGFPPHGCSSYYSPDITQEEAEMVGGWMLEHRLHPANTRIFKRGPRAYELHVACSKLLPRTNHAYRGSLGGCTIDVVYGDLAEHLAGVVEELTAAQPHAANEVQGNMLAKYIAHFETGNVELHKDSQRLWVQDRGPVVETNIGFIESYRDPLGVRAEFEGLVAVVNKDMSAKFGALVEAASDLLTTLPWPPEFEKDVFLQPDFTSLDVVAFASTGVPAGINIPNYDEVRQNEGFKNVSLGNVLSAVEQGNEPVTFITETDQGLYRNLKAAAFEVQVGAHELLGHGSGKMLRQNEDGSFNFDRTTINPLTGEAVESWYRPGETWDSVFGQMSSALEECRAEAAGCFFSANPKVLEIFGHMGRAAEDITYVNWLLMARMGLVALEFYSPETRKWRQAHMQARYALLRTMLEAADSDPTDGPAFVEVRELLRRNEAGTLENDLEVHMNRDKLLSVGQPAVTKLLKKLQVYRATADATGGGAMFESLTSVDNLWLARRKVVLERKQPRPIYVQPHTELVDGGADASLVEFEPSHAGVVESFITRF